MIRFSYDRDILKHEPVLFSELHLPTQVRVRGSGAALSGTTLTDAAGDFTNAGVEAGGVVHLASADGVLDGAYEIISVDSVTQLTVSVLRADDEDDAIAPPAASDVTYRISTFAPQIAEVAFELTGYFGLQPGDPISEASAESIIDAEGLRHASTLAVIASVYATWNGWTSDAGHWQKSQHYRQRFETAQRRCRLALDLDGDGTADAIRTGGTFRLARD